MKKILAPGVCAVLALGTTTAWAAEFGHVVSVTPVIQATTVMQQSCTQQEVTSKPPQSIGGTLFGTVAGALVGSTVGRGNGQLAATAVGAAAGALAGNSVDRANSQPVTTPVQTCQTVPVTQPTVVSYHVTYEYHGRQYTADMPLDPGTSVALQFDPNTGNPLPALAGLPPAQVDADLPPPPPVPVVVAPAYYAVPPIYGTVVVGGGWRR